MDGDSLLASTDIEDALAQLYVAGVAAKLGYVTSKKDFDRDGVDITIEAGGGMRPKLDLQLKATINLSEVGAKRDCYSFQCPKRNYDLLRLQSQTPRLLVVMRLPKDQALWLSLEPEELVLRHSAYWISLLGAPSIDPGKASKSVHLPKANKVDVTGLRNLMNMSRTGKIT